MWFCANLLTYVILLMPLNNYEQCTMSILQMWNWGSMRVSKFAHVKQILLQLAQGSVRFQSLFCLPQWYVLPFIRSPDKFLILCQEYGCTKRTFSKFWKDYFWMCNYVKEYNHHQTWLILLSNLGPELDGKLKSWLFYLHASWHQHTFIADVFVFIFKV